MFLGLDALTWAFVAVGLLIAAALFVRNRKEGNAYEWDPRPWTGRERIIGGIWLAAFLSVQASYMAGWRLLGDYDKQGVAGLMLGGLVLIAAFPTVKRT